MIIAANLESNAARRGWLGSERVAVETNGEWREMGGGWESNMEDGSEIRLNT